MGRGIIFEHRFWIIFEHRCPGSFSNTEWVIFEHMGGGYPAAPVNWGGGWGGAVTFASYCVTVPLRPGVGVGVGWGWDRRLLRGGATAYWGWGGGGWGAAVKSFLLRDRATASWG